MRRLLWFAGLLPVGTLLSQACGLIPAAEAPPQTPGTPPSPAAPSPQEAPRIVHQEQRVPDWPAGTERLQRVVASDPSVIVLPPRFQATTSRPALVFLHGHGMDEHQMVQRTTLAHRAAGLGWLAAANLGSSRTHWGNDAALRATAALIDVLVKDYGADPQHLYLVGFSMGGGTALLMAINPLQLPYRIAAVASSQGFSDLAAMAALGPFRQSIHDAFGGSPRVEALQARSPISQVERLQGTPLYLEHGEADTAVPVQHTVRMRERLAALDIAAEVRLYPGVKHHEDSIDEAAIMRFFQGIHRNGRGTEL